jgi:hypothetical protein
VAKVAHFLKLSREGGSGEVREDVRVAVATLYQRHKNVQKNLVFVVNENQVYSSSYAIALTSIVCHLVSCVAKDSRAEDKRGPRHTPWYDEADQGKVFLVRSSNTSRFV